MTNFDCVFWQNPPLLFASGGGILKITPILQEEFLCVFKSHEPEEAYRDFFETNDIYEAKDFAMRLAFDETNLVCVRDERRDEIVRDFDAEVYR